MSKKPVIIEKIGAIGVFDGVHLGHQALIQETVAQAKARDLSSIIVTFDNHPDSVLYGENIPLLTTPAEKKYLVKKAGVDLLMTLPFTHDVATLSPHDFLLHMYGITGLRGLVIGSDFALGAGRRGNYPALKKIGEEMGIEITRLPAVQQNGQTISSTLVRRALIDGNLDKANSLLGHPYLVIGQVEKGLQRGKTIGFPTANLSIHPLKMLPPDGVYAVKVRIAENQYLGILNIGRRPTFKDSPRTFEVHLLDFTGNLYGCTLQTDIIKFIRSEQAFPDSLALARQISSDIQVARQILYEDNLL